MMIKLPEHVSAREARMIMDELRSELRLDRPRIVVDLSEVQRMDSEGLDMLLHCMVEVARRDGAVKLGGISPEAATVLELTRMDRVFEMFPTVSEAASSFCVAPVDAVAARASAQPAAAYD
jgi:anti-sigma B factor antagonist